MADHLQKLIGSDDELTTVEHQNVCTWAIVAIALKVYLYARATIVSGSEDSVDGR
jgi:hypothetical protein